MGFKPRNTRNTRKRHEMTWAGMIQNHECARMHTNAHEWAKGEGGVNARLRSDGFAGRRASAARNYAGAD